MTRKLQIETTPEKSANYEISVPGEDTIVAFTDRKEMFKYLHMRLDRPVDIEVDVEETVEESQDSD